MNPTAPEGRQRRVAAPSPSGREASVRRALAVTLLGATAAAVGPLGVATAHAQTAPSAERLDSAAADAPSAAVTGPAALTPTAVPGVATTLRIHVRSWPRESHPSATSPKLQTATPARSTPVGSSTPGGAAHGTPPGAATIGSAETRPPLLGSTVPVFQHLSIFPVPVLLPVDTTQVITVKAAGSHATVTVWQEGADQVWRVLATTSSARIGSAGLAPGETRVQGSDTTPTGTYAITQGFGVGPNPGTRVPYHQVTDQDWWVEDPTSAYYNTMRTAAQGGFQLTESGPDGSEHLDEYPVQYHNALVVDYNMDPAVPGRGAGIFLHDLAADAGPTAGCVAVPAAFLTQIMGWIDPGRHPVIAIG